MHVWGEDLSPTVVLVHGFMGSAAVWGELPRRLAVSRRVLVPDLPGHGQSAASYDAARYEVRRLAADVAWAAQTLAPGPTDWVGYSMGGRIALAAAAEGIAPIRRMVLESASPGLSAEHDRNARQVADEVRATDLERDGMTSFVDAWLEQPLFATQRRLPSSVLARERSRRIAQDPMALAACLRGGGTGTQPSYWGHLASIMVPTLLLTGSLDSKFEALADRMADRLPDVVRRTVPGAGHAVHLEAPDLWLRAVGAFLGVPTGSDSRGNGWW